MPCRKTFCVVCPANKTRRQYVWFHRWVTEGYSVRQIAQQCGHSQPTIRRVVAHWLQRSPPLAADLSSCKHVIFDGTYLNGRTGIFAVMDYQSTSVVGGGYGISERPHDLSGFCAQLHAQGLEPCSATVDGNPHLSNALRTQWPSIIIQRCLVHVQRQGLMWCRRHPKRTDTKHLRDLLLTLTNIRTRRYPASGRF